MHFGVSTLSLEHCSTGKRKMETDCQCKGPLWAGLRPQPFSLSQCSGAHTLLSKDYLWSIHHPSTCNQLMEPLTISPTVKKRKRGERGRGKKCKPSFISQTALKLCFVSPWSAIIPVCMSQTVGVGVGEGRRVGVGGHEDEDFWKTLSHSLEWWHGSNETEERDMVL